MRSTFMWRTIRTLVVGLLLMVASIPSASAQPPIEPVSTPKRLAKIGPQRSGIYDLHDAQAATANHSVAPQGAGLAHNRGNVSGFYLTECPQAGLQGTQPQPLDQREIDRVEQLSRRGDDIRVNQDYSCFPQNETSVDVNPRTSRNIVVGANDYRLGWGTSGFYASTDGGRSWYDGIIPFPSLPNGDNLDGGGDPVIAFDRAGVVYYSEINFNRTDDTGGVFVSRSTNGGFTWTRMCVPIDVTPDDPGDNEAVCGGPGDIRQPGDGVVTFNLDDNTEPDFSIPFDDKEWLAAGPRPAGVDPVCFTPITREPTECDRAVVGVDRLYVTWTRFAFEATSAISQTQEIYLSYSDDQARSWSPPKAISGSADFCIGLTPGAPNRCDGNQFSVPTVHPRTGALYVSFQNSNTPDENQYLLVRSKDGGATFEGPYFVTPVYDLNFPRSGITREDCADRGQQTGRIVYTNSCFRSNAGGNVVVDKRGGSFADDLYLVISDNRNGTIGSSNADIFLFKSNDGGQTWIGPTRVNDDFSSLGNVSRDCGREPGTVGELPIPRECIGNFGNDQWWPWVDIGEEGQLNITFFDRRLDRDSVDHEWADLGSRQRPGNYLVWRWGAQCRVNKADSRDCLAGAAKEIEQPDAPIDPGDDPVTGQGNAFLGSLRNFQISDVPSNFDYSFRAGLFAGDYENVTVAGNRAYATWTDARNGRSTRNQPGRNPICEQSDVFLAVYSATSGGSGGSAGNTQPFLVTPCPAAK